VAEAPPLGLAQMAEHCPKLPDLLHTRFRFAPHAASHIRNMRGAAMFTDLKVWRDHFEYHAERRCALPLSRRDDFTSYERRLVSRSIATFQLKVQSDQGKLLRAARRYEESQHSAPLAQIVELLIAEEKHHAALLSAFMAEHGLPRTSRGWTSAFFRSLSGSGGFEMQLSVRMTDELIGKVYCRALETATGCRQLQVLCRMLVANELAHVGFESDLLRSMQARRAPMARAASGLMLRGFYTVASLKAWFTHRPVLRAAGYRMGSFLRACGSQYAFYLEPPLTRTEEMRSFQFARPLGSTRVRSGTS
jgi:hypothetical protein